jgi:transcription factor Dp-1/transcription factor Dp-2
VERFGSGSGTMSAAGSSPLYSRSGGGPANRPSPGRRSNLHGKGLRNFSLRVCTKLAECGATTYNEIANLLVRDIVAEHPLGAGEIDEKNIRRRIYDALNVLMAIGVIEKEKKRIRWIGVPNGSGTLPRPEDLADDAPLSPRSSSSGAAPRAAGGANGGSSSGGGGGSGANGTLVLGDSSDPVDEEEVRHKQVEEKRQMLEFLTLQYLNQRVVMERNATPQALEHRDKLFFPFLLVQTAATTDITCEMTEDRSRIMFDFNAPFRLHDFHVMLQLMGAQDTSRIRALVPAELRALLPNLCKEPGAVERATAMAEAAVARSAVGDDSLDAREGEQSFGRLRGSRPLALAAHLRTPPRDALRQQQPPPPQQQEQHQQQSQLQPPPPPPLQQQSLVARGPFRSPPRPVSSAQSPARLAASAGSVFLPASPLRPVPTYRSAAQLAVPPPPPGLEFASQAPRGAPEWASLSALSE